MLQLNLHLSWPHSVQGVFQIKGIKTNEIKDEKNIVNNQFGDHQYFWFLTKDSSRC